MTCKYDKTNEVAEEYKTFLDKYFEPKYTIVPPKQGTEESFEDYCILQHSNKVCVLTLAEGHSLLDGSKSVTEVDFQITATTNRMENKVVGKAKRGAQWLTLLSPICRVKCSDGSTYTLRSGLPGKLIEVNERLSANPSLLTEKPFTEGFLAIIIPKQRDWEAASANFLGKEGYVEAIRKRTAPCVPVSRGGDELDVGT